MIEIGQRVFVNSGDSPHNFSGPGTVVGQQGIYFLVESDTEWDRDTRVFEFRANRIDPLMESAAKPELFPVDSASRKNIPVTTGVFDYFPAALAAVAAVSKAGNDKHNPGQPLHWARGKSTDQADAIGRHLLERGGIDPDTGMRYSAQLAWRALALLQLELEEAGEAPLARGAINEGGEE